MFKHLAVLAATFLFYSSSVHAVDYKFEFKATDFYSEFTTSVTPQAVVAGSFIFSMESPGGPFTSIRDVDLSIDHHRYTVPELALRSDANFFIVGGAHAGPDGIANHTDDFWVAGTPLRGILDVSYTTASSEGFWHALVLTSNYSPVTSIPEPDTYAMLLAGLGLLGVAGCRRKATGSPTQK